MKFQFKIQQYQTDAVNSVVGIFEGQPYQNHVRYIRDLGTEDSQAKQTSIQEGQVIEEFAYGFENAKLTLSQDQILKNIQKMQEANNIQRSDKLLGHLGACSLDVEMETGTGKTYVYIKTIFELNKRYGWSKFIVVVPSIAIREGVNKTFEITADHFYEHYKKKARFFIYNSSNLESLDDFSSSSGIQVMIVNTQAFAASMNEEKNVEGRKGDAAARIIFSHRDNFGSRRPIDVIAANRPILILDEPQKMGKENSATQKAMLKFNPLFTLNYSATHREQHNLVYVLDAVDAFNKRLVKKIEVKGFDLRNLHGTNHYMFLENILVAPNKPPRAKLEIEVNHQRIKREAHIVDQGTDLYVLSKGMEQYKDYTVSDIDPVHGAVYFTNNEVILRGEVIGDVSEDNLRRIQIRETIISHFEKERKLFSQGIKTLSLFFIDEVANYRVYDENGMEQNGHYGVIFEEEYNRVLNDYLTLFEDEAYRTYLTNIRTEDTHEGYFSIDKKGHKVNSSTKRGSDESDDISAYDLILKKKEVLLSFENPVRFIFSHSALREGWDNPNVFQICTLKHGGTNPVQKRQEVGRGLRLCVDQKGERMDAAKCGSEVHKTNVLTVIASEGYDTFVSDLQTGIKDALYDRPSKANAEYFLGKSVMVGDRRVVVSSEQSREIYKYLLKNGYIDDQDGIAPSYREAQENGTLAPLPETITPITEGVHTLIQSVFDPSVLNNMVSNGNQTRISRNPLNGNYNRQEFQKLWSYINHKYAYTVDFDSDELIRNAIAHINEKMYVTRLQYTVTTGIQNQDMDHQVIEQKDGFEKTRTRTERIVQPATSQIKYDLIGKIAEGTRLTRKTVASILSGLQPHIFEMFKHNPEEFIKKSIKYINEKKAEVIIGHITYQTTNQAYSEDIFQSDGGDYARAYPAKKHIQDYVFTEGIAQKCVERNFAQDLDAADEVCVYAKLPRSYHIPTPVGNYSPDWAIAFNEGSVKHIYFIAETKGSMDEGNHRGIEAAKIKCAEHLFNRISTSKVRYYSVDKYETLLDIMDKL